MKLQIHSMETARHPHAANARVGVSGARNTHWTKRVQRTPQPHQNHTFPPCEEPSWQNQMAVRWSWGLPRKLKPEASARSSEAASQQVQRNLKDLESHLSSAVSKANCAKNGSRKTESSHTAMVWSEGQEWSKDYALPLKSTNPIRLNNMASLGFRAKVTRVIKSYQNQGPAGKRAW